MLRSALFAAPRRASGAWATALQSLLRVRPAVLISTDSQGIIRSVLVPNPQRTGSLTAMLAGRSLIDVFDPETYTLVSTACRKAAASGRLDELGCLFDSPESPRWMSVSISPARDGRGKVSGFQILLRDPAIRRRLHVRVRPEATLLDRAVARGRLGTFEADLTDGDLLCSEQLFEILGAPHDDSSVQDFLWQAIGGCYRDLFATARHHSRFRSGESVSFSEDIEVGSACGHKIINVRTVCAPEPLALPSRIAGVIEDVTEARTLDAKLRKQAALLSATDKLMESGSWELDVPTGEAALSDELLEILELPRNKSNRSEYVENLHPEDRDRVRQMVAQAIHNSTGCEYVSRYRTPSGDWRVHKTSAVPVANAAGAITQLIGVVRDISEQTRVEQNLHRLSQRLMRARDQERRTLARELHESAGQSLAALKMTLGNLREALRNSGIRSRSLLEACCQITEEVIREIRTVSYLMHPPMLDEAGLAPAIRWYARGFSDRSKIEVTVDVAETFGRLDREIETTVFRLIQEALTNIHRYSGSRKAWIRLAREKAYVRVEVVDAGCGLARPIRLDSGDSVGVGIAGMRERIKELNGIFEIETAPGRGTTVRALFPESIPVEQPVPLGETRAARAARTSTANYSLIGG